ncbi:transcription initiation factor TFIID subunit D5 [Terfezia boudieri ATCC MYA-4762]|uniref:TBP-associated factor 6 n=1 Tax=Terfezia boudieri ATCC MYA-4762 TaxID=1051890 RepID=A0A3N4L7X1_9PEZI|nr:transcription initiation factor TFIID subunit D5 [Terfezia boudieri ATCC MYA-4762]
MTSLWSTDTIRDVAESVGITSLPPEVSSNLAMDVEYRIHQVLQEALKFMKHAKRTLLTTADVSHALKVLDIEPLYGYDTTRPIRFGEASLGRGQPMFYVEDDEVDFEKLVNAPLPKVPREVSMTAHWLAIEGVQPAIPQNPTPTESRSETTAKGSTTNHSVAALGSGDSTTVKPLVKHILSKELQLYFEKVCEAVLNEHNESLRSAAFASLRHDPGLHQLLPYFVQFVSEKVTHGLKHLFTLGMMMQFTWAVLENEHLFIDPYVSSMVPPVLTCLIGKRLGDPNASQGPNLAHFELRDLSASLIALLCKRFGDSTHTLKPRLTRTCLKAFLDPSKPPGTHYGAIKGLHAIGGKESVWVLIIPNLKLYETILKEGLGSEDEMKRIESEMVLKAIVRVLKSLEEEQELVVGANGNRPDEMEITNGDGEEELGGALRKRLIARIGEVVAEEVCKSGKKGLALAILDAGVRGPRA